MMDYFFFMLCLLSIINSKIKGYDQFFIDYMNIENTNCIRGIFVWLIIFLHKTPYGVEKNYLYKIILKFLGQKVVSMFFYYSGFGIYESIKKKGYNYIKFLPIKGIILFIKFQIILLIFLITNIYILNNKITLKRYLLSCVFISAIGNSNWFAFTIIIFYFYSYLSFIYIKNFNIGIFNITIFCVFHSIIVYKYFYPRNIVAVDTVFCFPLGYLHSLIKISFDDIVMKNDIRYFGITSLLILIYYKVFYSNNILYICEKNAIFALLIVIISMKVKINNDFLNFLGNHSYSIYLLQKIVILIVYKKQIFKNSDFIRISFELTSIFFISALFDKNIMYIEKMLKKKLNNLCYQKSISFDSKRATYNILIK